MAKEWTDKHLYWAAAFYLAALLHGDHIFVEKEEEREYVKEIVAELTKRWEAADG